MKRICVLFASLLSAVLLTSCGESSEASARVDQLIETAHRAYRNDMPELAASYCDEAIALCPDNWKPYALLGYLDWKREGLADAIPCFEKVAQLNTGHDLLIFSDGTKLSYDGIMAHLAWCYAVSNQPERALLVAQQVVERQPDNVLSMSTIAYVYTAQGKYDKAEIWARKLLAARGGHGAAYFRLAYLADEQGRRAEAIRYYEECLKEAPASAQAMNNLSILCWDTDRPRAIELRKRAARLGYRRAQTWLKRKGYEW